MSNHYGLTTNLVQAATEPRYPVADNQVIAMPDANLTLPVQPQGRTLIVRAGALGAARTLTLPSLVNSQGVIVHVIVDAALGNNLTVAAPAGTLCGMTYVRADSATNGRTNSVSSAAATSLEISGANAVVGDRAVFICDGVKWQVNAWSASVANAQTWTFA